MKIPIAMNAVRNFCLLMVILLLGGNSITWAQRGPAFSGLSAAADNAMTAATNPAGLTRLKKTEIVIGATPIYSPAKFELQSGTTASGSEANDDSTFAVAPSFYLSKPIGDKWRLGFALTIPMGIGTDYGNDWAGRYINQESNLVFIVANPVVAYRVNNWFSVGGGIQLMYVSVNSKPAVNKVLSVSFPISLMNYL